MLLLPLFLALFVESSRATTKSCQVVENTVVLQYVNVKKSWDDARKHCQDRKKLGISGDLVSDHTAEVHNFVDAQNTLVWIGARSHKSGKYWKWVDGLTIDTDPKNKDKRWAKGEPNNGGGNQHCMVANYLGHQWDDQACSTKLNFICQYKIKGYEFVKDRLVKFVRKEAVWQEAKEKCEEGKPKGSLIVIDSKEIKEWVAEKGSVWVGASDLKQTGKWKWTNGKPLSEKSEFWAPGAPDNQVKAEHCAVMQSNGINDVYCRQYHSYACQYSSWELVSLVC